MDGRAGDVMRLASSTTSITSSFYISFTSFFLFLSTLFLLLAIAEAGTHLDEPWFRWRDGNVNFYFKDMTNADRRVMRNMMRMIEQRTCLRFREQRGPLTGHHLLVRGSSTTCLSGPGGRPRFSATVHAVEPNMTQVILESYYQLADSDRCVAESKGGLLHELFHVFGVMHTQKRADRDRHVRVLKENIKDKFEHSYDICYKCKDYGVPYDCDSIMHFGTETFSLGRPTMEARDSSCDLRWVGAAFDGRHGSSIASPWDWELLKRIAARLCPAATSTNSRRPTSGGNQRRPRKQGRGKRHSIE